MLAAINHAVLWVYCHPAVFRIVEVLTFTGGHTPFDGHGHFGAF